MKIPSLPCQVQLFKMSVCYIRMRLLREHKRTEYNFGITADFIQYSYISLANLHKREALVTSQLSCLSTEIVTVLHIFVQKYILIGIFYEIRTKNFELFLMIVSGNFYKIDFNARPQLSTFTQSKNTKFCYFEEIARYLLW